MYYKRNEPFRYTFGTPTVGTIQKAELEEETQTYEAKILDLSQHGAKIEVAQDEKWDNGTPILIRFSILEEEFVANGIVKWHKQLGSTHLYGLDLETSEEWRKSLINNLKQLAKDNL
ncbi:PilZ domain-containing protein [Pontibacillus yanchengensis]|nr:PilZ domain-containing protein [Pontibacillus yanchengensis]